LSSLAGRLWRFYKVDFLADFWGIFDGIFCGDLRRDFLIQILGKKNARPEGRALITPSF